MKKQIALIIVSLLASMSAAAQNVNENICNNEMCRVHTNTPICEMGEGVIQPDLDFIFGTCPEIPDIGIKPEIPEIPEVKPEIPDTPIVPEKPEEKPEIPDTPVIPDEPVLPDVPEFDKPEEDTPEIEVPDSSLATQVLSLVQSERAKYGLDAVTYDTLLSSAANIRAVEIKSLFSHTRPDGRSCFTALDEVGYSYRKAGENIAYEEASAEEAMGAWMTAEGDRANILGDYDYIGIGVYEKGGVIYWSQFFAGQHPVAIHGVSRTKP